MGDWGMTEVLVGKCPISAVQGSAGFSVFVNGLVDVWWIFC